MKKLLIKILDRFLPVKTYAVLANEGNGVKTYTIIQGRITFAMSPVTMISTDNDHFDEYMKKVEILT